MKAILAGIYSFLMVFVATVGTFAAEEAKKEGGGGYDSTAYVWIALIVIQIGGHYLASLVAGTA